MRNTLEKEWKQLRSEEEYIAVFLQELITGHYDKTRGHVRLYVCQKTDRNGEWSCLFGDEQTRNAVAKLLSDRDGQIIPENQEIEIVEKTEYILYSSILHGFQDSRLSRDKSLQELAWIWIGDTVKESLRLILKIFTNELEYRITDMLYLERIWELSQESEGTVQERIKELKENNTYQYFFGNLMDKEWLNREYVKLSLHEHGLPEWKIFLEISASFYEKRTISTCIYFLEKDEEIQKQYKPQFDIRKRSGQIGVLETANLRTIRKVMELSGAEHGLVVRKPEYIFEGIVDKTDSAEWISIEFEGHLVWRLKKGKETIFEYCEGEFKLPELESKDDSESELDKLREFPCTETEKDKINQVVRNIKARSGHGTSIVFMDSATLAEEVERLGDYNRAYQVEEFDLLDLSGGLPGILGIDGAILAGMDCRCCVIGAIVDGETKIKGRSDRGARYNSLVNYVHVVKEREMKKKEIGERMEEVFCCAVIISEDETIDIEIP